MRAALVEAIKVLPEREQYVMSMYYEHDMNLKEIAAVLKVTESRVCQLHSQSIARLRVKLRASCATPAPPTSQPGPDQRVDAAWPLRHCRLGSRLGGLHRSQRSQRCPRPGPTAVAVAAAAGMALA